MTTTDQKATRASAAPEPPTSGAAAEVWAALTANPDSTASAIAKAAKVSNTTAGKALAALEKDGLATRTRGSGAGRSRIPDTWTAVLPTDSDTPTIPEADTSPAGDEQETATANPPTAEAMDDDNADTSATPDATTPATDDLPITPTGGPAADEPPDDTEPTPPPDEDADGETGDSDEANTAEQDNPSSTADAAPAHTTGNGRLGKGELRAMVADHLATHLDSDFTPTRLSRILGRSSGAIANALDALVRAGEAVQTRDKPIAYAHPTATVDTASPVPRAHRTPRTRSGGRHRGGVAALIARATAAHTHATSLDADHPNQPGWGRYALIAQSTLAAVLDISADEIHLAVEPRTDTESWVRMTLADPTATDDSGASDTADAPTLDATETEDTVTELVFTAPWDEPTKILSISACPSCGKPAPTYRIAHPADLGAQLASTSTTTASASGATLTSELHNHPTHEPTCPYAATA